MHDGSAGLSYPLSSLPRSWFLRVARTNADLPRSDRLANPLSQLASTLAKLQQIETSLRASKKQINMNMLMQHDVVAARQIALVLRNIGPGPTKTHFTSVELQSYSSRAVKLCQGHDEQLLHIVKHVLQHAAEASHSPSSTEWDHYAEVVDLCALATEEVNTSVR